MTRPAADVLNDLAAADAELARWHSRRADLQRELAPALRRAADPAPAPSDFLTTREAAALLGVSAGHLKALRAEGRGPRCVRVGRSVRYRRSDLSVVPPDR